MIDGRRTARERAQEHNSALNAEVRHHLSRRKVDRAFQILLTGLYSRIYRYIVYRLKEYADIAAENLTQEVFLRLHQQLDSQLDHENPVALTFTIASRICIDNQRRASRRRRNPAVMIEINAIARSSQRPDCQFEHKERQIKLDVALRRISEEKRTLIIIDREGLSVEESAKEAQLSIGQYSYRLRSAYDDIRQIIKELYETT